MKRDTPIICDLGTGYMKMGFAGQNFPNKTFPSVVGRPMLRYEQTIDDVQLKPIMVGDEVTKYRSLLQLSYPTEEGMVKNWDDMHLLLDYSFKNIGVNSMSGKSIFMTEAVMNPIKNRVKMAELLFEKFGVGRFQLGVQALMSLFAEGLETAMLVDSGDGVTHCIPVVDMAIMSNQIGRMNLAGRHITNHLVKLMSMRGYAFNSTADFELIRQMKERYCFVSGDVRVDNKLAAQTTYHQKIHKLPDGSKIKIGSERYLAPQILFNPLLAGIDCDGISNMVYKSIMKCDLTLRGFFFKKILISGGTTMFPGFPTRLRNDVQYIHREITLKGSVSKDFSVTVADPPTRKYNVFIGASWVANSTNDLDQAWVSKQQYQQQGSRIIEAMNYNIK